MNNDDKKIVAIYTRVSTTDQAREGHSLEEQEKRLRAMCEANGYKVYKVYTDAGISGKSADNRPAYQQMMKDMRDKKFNLITAFKMDRISRSIVDFEEFFTELKEYNCGIEFLCEKIDTSGAAGMMFARILGIFAQFERELIKERTLVGVESAVNKGHFGGRPPLGYKNKLDENGEKLKEWEIDEEEAKIVREIFDLCSKGKTYFQISNILKKKYPKCISYIRTNKETKEKEIVYRKWTDGSLSTILNNRKYIGIYEHRKTVKDKQTIEIIDKVPAIINEDLFDECQDNIKRNSRNYYRSKLYLFMQKIICPTCGRILSCNGTKKPNGTEYKYYKCFHCGDYVREEYVEKSLIDKLCSYFELYNALGDDYVAIDKDLAEAFNNSRLDHRLRFKIDENIIEKKYGSDFDRRDFDFHKIWNLASDELKANFIYEYVDIIKLDKIKRKKNNICDIQVANIKLRDSKIKKLFKLGESNMIDKVIQLDARSYSIADFKRESDALEYIDILKKKYDILTEDYFLDDYQGFYFEPSFFKEINIRPTKAIEKGKMIFLYLREN